MNSPLDLDQLQTFVAIADSGSFTRAAEVIFKTQSAVSMQMRRLEERIDKPLFERDGRNNRLTEDGQKLLIYARRMIRLNHEAIAAFDDHQLEGHIRIGMPDDYADRFLPEIMARFSRSNPRIELSVVCEPSINLNELIKKGELDIALVTQCDQVHPSEILRHEQLLWVTSANHNIHEEPVLPLAVGRSTCVWRRSAINTLVEAQRDYRILFTSWSTSVISAAVLAGLAVAVLPECALRPGMRVLNEADGFTTLPKFGIGILRGINKQANIMDALVQHIVASLETISTPAAMPHKPSRQPAGQTKNKKSSAHYLAIDW
ncbi:LysR substrate-binding domain-containing protein [Brucellaceae bacterium C25G]